MVEDEKQIIRVPNHFLLEPSLYPRIEVGNQAILLPTGCALSYCPTTDKWKTNCHLKRGAANMFYLEFLLSLSIPSLGIFKRLKPWCFSVVVEILSIYMHSVLGRLMAAFKKKSVICRYFKKRFYDLMLRDSNFTVFWCLW